MKKIWIFLFFMVWVPTSCSNSNSGSKIDAIEPIQGDQGDINQGPDGLSQEEGVDIAASGEVADSKTIEDSELTSDKSVMPDALDATDAADSAMLCLKVPQQVDFGTLKRDENWVAPPVDQKFLIYACGTQAVTITGLTLKQDQANAFAIDMMPWDHKPTKASPVQIPANSDVTLSVSYTPRLHPPAGTPTNNTGYIQITSNAGEFKIMLKGRTVDLPMADFTMEARICDPPTCNPDAQELKNCTTKAVESGDILPARTMVQLHDHSRVASSGEELAAWSWSGGDTYEPGPDAREPSVCLDKPGRHDFTLKVTDKAGNESRPVKKYLAVLSQQGLRIELTWDTPADQDQTDRCPVTKDCGSDMDLHLLHPNAGDNDQCGRLGYFTNIWDCYWNNPDPLWSEQDRDANPSLVRDDVDGAGPEIIQVLEPEVFSNGKCYRVGVHYFDDHGFGESLAYLKVYVDGTLVWKNSQGVAMKKLDLWNALDICWATDHSQVQVKEIVPDSGSGPVIVHNVNRRCFFFVDQTRPF